MQNIACIADNAINCVAQEPQRKAASAAVKNLFMMLQGNYGSLFIAKFSTGVKDDAGRDMGIRAAMLTWDAALARFAPAVLELAMARCTEQFREFPPNLPQFVALCNAAQPRQTFAQQQGLPALPAPMAAAAAAPVQIESRNDGKNWARRHVARAAAGERINRTALLFAKQALGMAPQSPMGHHLARGNHG